MVELNNKVIIRRSNLGRHAELGMTLPPLNGEQVDSGNFVTSKHFNERKKQPNKRDFTIEQIITHIKHFNLH